MAQSREAHAIYMRQWSAENREKVRQQKAEYRKRNAEKIKEAEKAKREARTEEQRERAREALRKWKIRNPGAVRTEGALRRARKRGATVERVSPDLIWKRDGGICHICSLPADEEDWHLEHIVPLCKGGEHSYANTAVSHPACNLRKGKK